MEDSVSSKIYIVYVTPTLFPPHVNQCLGHVYVRREFLIGPRPSPHTHTHTHTRRPASGRVSVRVLVRGVFGEIDAAR